MVTARYLFATLAMCAAFNFVIATEDKKEETDDAKSSSGLLNGTADDAKDKMEGGMDALKGVGKELTEEGVKNSQSFAEDIAEAISAGMGKVAEVGSEIKEAVGDAVLNAKDEFETVASTIEEYAKNGTFSKWLG
ncbi:hypothetical protein TNIN_463291 [Trichonephila inaurata madagascariensis]|uniref:Uncharacterized protein n=1 Tax=Trichonephila inaurata madagascariensis TaxID=2747483 RepID=A0A8X6Y0E4_9ARAC|nr:hypothetical protein TNIN_463291 [Trichonephila inaurata madagascariensis]